MRRGVRNVLGAGAAVLCLGGLLSACGGDNGDGYVATGAAGAAPERASGKTVGPTGDVKLVPLDRGGDGTTGGHGGSAKASSGSGAGALESGGEGGTEGKPSQSSKSSKTPNPSTGRGGSPTADDRAGGAGGSGPPPSDDGPGTPTPPSTGNPGTAEPPRGPAELNVGEPRRKPADKRWCEKVTVSFRNTGGSPVRSGTVTFGTHIIGALGVDWATIESTAELPVPIAPGQKKKKTWPVCVDAWRVPLGMHVETRDVSVKWG
ncbi:hypothetical protein ABZ953_08510 [Streptomyces sp. NPDC046465]|uniref:hypothetical protein n=1 Tax=Streptomyces sp. NPDC046465 TaxID=3155810 RepID=UPI0033D9312E